MTRDEAFGVVDITLNQAMGIIFRAEQVFGRGIRDATDAQIFCDWADENGHAMAGGILREALKPEGILLKDGRICAVAATGDLWVLRTALDKPPSQTVQEVFNDRALVVDVDALDAGDEE